MNRMPQFDPKMRWWDTLTTLLMMMCLFIATLRLISTHWTENLAIVQPVAFLGIILGLALGQSSFSPRVGRFFTLAYGIFVIPWQLGITMEKEVPGWMERLVSMRGRLEVIVGELLRRESVTDNLFFILAMTCLFWVLSVHTGYIITRQANPWKAVLPTGVAVFAIHSFDPLSPRRSWYLAFYLFFALLLVARMVYLHNRQSWKQTHTHTPADVGFDFSRFAVVVAMILVLLAWNVPVLAGSLEPISDAWVSVTRPWRSFKDRFGFAFASLRASVGMVSNMYGESMLLGRGTPLGDNVVLNVEVPPLQLDGARLYWRGRIYDTYNNGAWDNSFNEKIQLTPESLDLNIAGADQRQIVSLTITAYDAFALMYTASQPLWVSRNTTASLTSNSDGTVDLGALAVNEYIRPGEQYETRSSLASVSITELREAGTDYPQWVVDKYLQLPDSITYRTYELAQRLADGKETPYDIAQGVTDYLRTNIKYTSIVPDPPNWKDRIDWFLFDLREGYCNYYATAEVVLLRSLGIPARLAVGFAQGERVLPDTVEQTPGSDKVTPESIDGQAATYVVRQRDAHAWPEVYFPGIGWVEFEPTSSQDALVRPLGGETTETAPNEGFNRQEYLMDPLEEPDILKGLDTPAGTSLEGKFWTPKTIVLMSLMLVSLALLGYIVWQVRRGFRLVPYVERLANEVPVRLESGFLRFGIRPPLFLSAWANYVRLPSLSRSYLQVNYALNRLGNPPEVHETPAERVNQLSRVLPPAKVSAQTLLDEYQAVTYSQHFADEVVAQQAGKEIRKLSYRAVFNRWLARIRKQPYKSS